MDECQLIAKFDGKKISKCEQYKILTERTTCTDSRISTESSTACRTLSNEIKSYVAASSLLFDKVQALEYKEMIIRYLLQSERLWTENLLTFFINNCKGLDFLPAKYEEINLFRDWVGNQCMFTWLCNAIGNFLHTSHFGDYVEDKLYKQQMHGIKKKWLSSQALTKLVQLFNA